MLRAGGSLPRDRPGAAPPASADDRDLREGRPRSAAADRAAVAGSASHERAARSPRDYLAVRRALGYKLERDGQAAHPVPRRCSTRAGSRPITVDVALAWATALRREDMLAPQPAAGDPRLRGYLRLDRLPVEVPPSELLPDRAASRRPLPLHRRGDRRADRRGRQTLRTSAPRRRLPDADRLARRDRDAARRGDRARPRRLRPRHRV